MDERYRIGDASFIWAADKAASNRRKHGLAFSTAAEALLDPFVVWVGEEPVRGEVRETVIGMTSNWRLVVVVYTYRAEAIRIISARAATRAERSQYEQQ